METEVSKKISVSTEANPKASEPLKLTVGWLYPKQMSTYGDRGNILTLWQRCYWRGINIEVTEIEVGETVDPTKYDLYFFGGGQDQAQSLVSEDLKKTKSQSLKKAARLGSVFFGICGGYQLFGHFYRPIGEKEIEGIGILDTETLGSGDRMIGNIVLEVDEKLNNDIGKFLVGFENHSGKTFLGKKAKPLGKVTVGKGNNGEDRTEGAFEGNVFGCYLHGPVLPKNPKFADFLIKRALERRYNLVDLAVLDDVLETSTHEVVIDRAKQTQ